MVRDFLDSGKYVLINATEKVKGGPWTREDPADIDNKSVLDLVITSAELVKYIEYMEIDKYCN